MYLHLGHGEVARYDQVVGVFDLDHVSASPRTREFLHLAQKEGKLIPLGDNLPVSLVVTAEGAFLSPISAQTLARRMAENQVP